MDTVAKEDGLGATCAYTSLQFTQGMACLLKYCGFYNNVATENVLYAKYHFYFGLDAQLLKPTCLVNEGSDVDKLHQRRHYTGNFQRLRTFGFRVGFVRYKTHTGHKYGQEKDILKVDNIVDITSCFKDVAVFCATHQVSACLFYDKYAHQMVLQP